MGLVNRQGEARDGSQERYRRVWARGGGIARRNDFVAPVLRGWAAQIWRTRLIFAVARRANRADVAAELDGAAHADFRRLVEVVAASTRRRGCFDEALRQADRARGALLAVRLSGFILVGAHLAQGGRDCTRSAARALRADKARLHRRAAREWVVGPRGTERRVLTSLVALPNGAAERHHR